MAVPTSNAELNALLNCDIFTPLIYNIFIMKSFTQYIKFLPCWDTLNDFQCFKDYIGNSLFALELHLSLKKDYQLKEMFQELFERLKVSLKHGFKEETGVDKKKS